MPSKLNYFESLTHPVVESKDTKFQKFLKERNAKLLEKCFNLKTEEPVIESKKKVTEIRKETPSKEISDEMLCQETSNSVAITADCQEIDLQQTTSQTKVESNDLKIDDEQQLKTETTKKNLLDSKPALPLESPNSNKTRVTSARSRNLKTLNTKQPTRLTSSAKWKSPFTSFTTNGTRSRLQRDNQSKEFSYDLSRDELKFANRFNFPMKPASIAERQLLDSGQRKEYLTQRYEHSPVDKYNYPEATSWRIGWLHRQQ